MQEKYLYIINKTIKIKSSNHQQCVYIHEIKNY